MIHYHDIEQRSEEWFEIKKGKLSASSATAIGANGKGLETLAEEKVLELLGLSNNYTNETMERGNDLEESAVFAYEMETGLNVKSIGFVENDKYKNTGVSPDGLIGDDGGCEIKARNNAKHLKLILDKADKSIVPYNQIQMCLMITERKWWDFVSYNPDHKKHIYIERFYPDLIYFEKLKKGILAGNQLIKQYMKIYNNYTPKHIIRPL